MQKIGIGYENYKRINDDDCYYVDKTLALSMLRTFFELEYDFDGNVVDKKDKRYEDGVIEDGYIGSVSYGICFCKKSCIVALL